jgi:16S rRNA (cytidine1402-2'-O)-methyltransferase
MAKRTEGDVKRLKGTLYLVSTPIGNLEDITLRALRVLKEADVVAAEDTRHSLKLLNHFGISKPMVSYWGEKEKTKSEEVLKKLLGGESVALVSDAGTPGISDPGAVLVEKALEEGVEVVPVPGPSALVTALSISGLSTEEFTYIGFLPSKKGQRQRKLGDLSLEPRTLVFFESPHRVIDTLIDMEKMLGNRKMALIKELTKMYESVYRGGLSEILDTLEDETIAGEYVIIVEGKEKGEMSIDEAVDEVKALMKKGLGRKESVKTVASEYGISKKELYDRSLKA